MWNVTVLSVLAQPENEEEKVAKKTESWWGDKAERRRAERAGREAVYRMGGSGASACQTGTGGSGYRWVGAGLERVGVGWDGWAPALGFGFSFYRKKLNFRLLVVGTTTLRGNGLGGGKGTLVVLCVCVRVGGLHDWWLCTFDRRTSSQGGRNDNRGVETF